MIIKKIKDIESRISFDLPTLLRNPSSCIEHVNDIISSKVTFIYRILSDKKRKFYKGRFHSIDKENNIIIELLSSPQNPEGFVNNVLEIMYSFRMNRIQVFETTILKYLRSKKGDKNIPIHIFLIKLPTSIKLDETIKIDDKREDVRFDVLSDYPMHVNIVSDKIDLPIDCHCIDFSSSGILLELLERQNRCLNYLVNDDIVEVFFTLPALPLGGEGSKKLLSQDFVTIQCNAQIARIKKGEEYEKKQIALRFLKIGYRFKDIIYHYGRKARRLELKR